MFETRPRLTYEDSCKALQRLGYLEKGSIPQCPTRRPRFDDGCLGVTFFRTIIDDGDIENMSLPRTYFAKSEVGPISFKNTNFSESNLCWNDFNEVDFTDADLSRSDLRASQFNRVIFVSADLSGSDLRQSRFAECDFADANMRDAKLTHNQATTIDLSEMQRAEISWQSDEGDPPDGG